MKLYEAPSPNARRVHIFMAEKGLECDRVAVDIRATENLSEDYLAKNPGGRVPLLELEDDKSAEDARDALIKTYDEHEDSVYSIAWSVCDPWIFASLSYDGRVAIRNVPSEEKYRILL